MRGRLGMFTWQAEREKERERKRERERGERSSWAVSWGTPTVNTFCVFLLGLSDFPVFFLAYHFLPEGSS